MRGFSVAIGLPAALLVIVGCSAGCSLDSGAHRPADLILRGGRVYVRQVSTAAEAGGAPKPLWLQGGTAVACTAGRVTYVGDDKGAERFRGSASRIVDLHGAVVVPGEPALRAGGPTAPAPDASSVTVAAPAASPAIEPGAPAEMTVFAEDPFEASAPEAAPPPVLYHVRAGELLPVFLDSPPG